MFRFLRLCSFALSLAASFAMTSCDQDAPTPEAPAESLLVGRWEFIQTSGGIAGYTTPADPDRKQEIVFGANGNVEFYLNGGLTTTNSYFTFNATSRNTGQPEPFVQYGPDAGSKLRVQQLDASELLLSQDYADGFTYHYIRR